MPETTQYGAFVQRMNRIANKHPRSYVVVDCGTMKVLATGRDFGAVSAKVKDKLGSGRIPVIIKKMPGKGKVLIL